VPAIPDDRFVFNLVWTGSVFPYLKFFVASLIDHSEARFRFVTNACPPDQIALMADFARARPERVIEVVNVSDDDMIAHGVCLDEIFDTRDDGDYFCFVDSDILATQTWVGEFAELLESHSAVTSGKEVWTDDNLVPVDHPGVAGEHFFARDGFVFGSPHLALYHRAALADTRGRWGVGFRSAGPELDDKTKARLADFGHEYLIYDTSKILNALLQADGHTLVHRDLPQLMHIGGLSHFISPPLLVEDENGVAQPDWVRYENMRARWAVTRFTASVLQDLVDGRSASPVPDDIEPSMEARLAQVRETLIDLVTTYADC
jgi:hypothetical protein